MQGAVIRWLVVAVGALLLDAACRPSFAAAADPAADQTPSVMTYAFDGLLFGAAVGLGGGYLRARQGGFEHDDWKPFVLGAGIGALAGPGVGLTLGFVDLATDRPHAQYILRDGKYGAAIGMLLGAITGALVLVRSDEPEHVGFGAAIGTLCGAGLGLLAGVIESTRTPKVAEPAPAPAAAPKQAFRPAPRLTLVRDAAGELRPLFALGARF